MNITDNVAYQSSTSEVKLSPNAAYTATGDHSPTSHDHEYMYVMTAASANQQVNTTMSINTTDTPTDETHNILTSTNVAYAIPTATNPAYVTTVPTSPNQAYQVVQGSSTHTYESISQMATDN